MTILSIETSCDETSAAVLTNSNGIIKVKSNVTATSLSMHSATGGIIPENAARMQVRYIIPVIVSALNKAFGNEKNDTDWEIASKFLKDEIDAIAITYGPGLIGSLLVGVETAKTLSFAFEKPLIPVNHLLAHIYANFISSPSDSLSNLKRDRVRFPFIGLIVSGGHTDLLFFKSHKNIKWLGGTRDDAAGEAMDKIGRLLDIPYPAGPEIERRATLFSLSKMERAGVRFKSPLIGSDDFDFSFSGLKTEALRFVQTSPLSSTLGEDEGEGELLKNEVCFATQKAVIDVLVKKTLKAANEFNCKTILVGGGVSANQTLKEKLMSEVSSQELEAKIYFPEKKYSTDNAAMIGAYALLNGKSKPWQEVTANPELYFS